MASDSRYSPRRNTYPQRTSRMSAAFCQGDCERVIDDSAFRHAPFRFFSPRTSFSVPASIQHRCLLQGAIRTCAAGSRDRPVCSMVSTSIGAVCRMTESSHLERLFMKNLSPDCGTFLFHLRAICYLQLLLLAGLVLQPSLSRAQSLTFLSISPAQSSVDIGGTPAPHRQFSSNCSSTIATEPARNRIPCSKNNGVTRSVMVMQCS